MKKMVDLAIHAIKKSDRIDGLVPEDKRYSVRFEPSENLEKCLNEFVVSFSKWLGEDSDVVIWESVGSIEEKAEENNTRES